MELTVWNRIKTAGKILFGGYDAIKSNRYRRAKGFHPIRDENIELPPYDRDELVGNLLNMKRNNPIVKSISRLKRTDVVGSGLVPQPATPSEEFNEQILNLYTDWAEHPEVTHMMNMKQVQQELVDAPLFFGDIGVLYGSNGLLQIFEGSRIGSPMGVSGFNENDPDKNGVIVNEFGRPIEYQIGRRVNGTLTDVVNVPADNFSLYMKRQRPSQWRGVPTLAPCVNTLMDVSEYEEIEMIAAKVSASLSAVIKREGAVNFELGNRAPDNEQDTVGRLENFEPGTFHYLEPGEDVSTIAPNGRPNVDGIEWLAFELRKVGAAIGIPYEFLLGDIGGSSFSASQGVVMQYQAQVEEEQNCLIDLMKKIYRWRVAKWVADGDLSVPAEVVDPFLVRFQPPRFRWINRSSQVESDLKYIALGAMSLDDVASTFGDSALNIMRRKAQNISDAKQVAAEFGIEDYRELFNQLETFANVNYADLLEQSENQTPETKQ
jgi:lambda family phage portal protein